MNRMRKVSATARILAAMMILLAAPSLLAQAQQAANRTPSRRSIMRLSQLARKTRQISRII